VIVAPPHPPSFCFPTIICPSQVVGSISQLAGRVASDAASSVLAAIGAGMVQAAVWLVQNAVGYVLGGSDPQLGAPWFGADLAAMEKVGLLVMLPLLCAASVGPVLRQDLGRLGRVWAVGLPVAVFAGLLAAELATVALGVVDALCSVVMGGNGSAVSATVNGALSPGALGGKPVFVQMFLAVMALAGGLMLWMELILRSAGVYLATFFMPLALAAYIWPATASIAKRAVEILVALILSKFVIVAALVLGVSALGQGIDTSMAGAAILLLAAFSPFVLLRFTPVVEAALVAHMEGLSHRPARMALSALGAADHPVVQMVLRAASAAAGRPDAVGADPGGGGGVRATGGSPPLPEAEADIPMTVGGAGRV
jgi:hypothetical protein